MQIDIKGLGSRTFKPASGGVRYYITAWRTTSGEDKAPEIARGDGRTLDEARAAAYAKLELPAVQARLVDLRRERAERKAVRAVPVTSSNRYIDGLVRQFLAYMDSAPDAAPAATDFVGVRRRKTKDIRTTSKAHRSNYRRFLENFRAEHATWKVSLFERADIIGDMMLWRDQFMGDARTPDYAMSAVSQLFAWARSRGLTKADPTKDIKAVYESNRSDIIWRAEHFAYAEKVMGPALNRFIRLAASIGMREADICKLPERIVTETSIARRTGKRNKLAVIPLTPDARKVIAEMRTANASRGADDVVSTTLANNENGRPWTKSALDSALRRLKATAAEDPDAPEGIQELHWHDLRGNAVTGFRLAGYSAKRIAQIFGWSEDRVEEMLAIYLSGDDIARAMLAELELERAIAAAPDLRCADEPVSKGY
jgi:site-specific recombinase XerD